MAEKADTASQEPKTIKFKLHLDAVVISVNYKDKYDLYESLKKKLDDLGIPITSVYTNDIDLKPIQLKDPDAVALAAGNYKRPLFARYPFGDAGDACPVGDVLTPKSHHLNANHPDRRRTSSTDSSTSRDHSPERNPRSTGSHHQHDRTKYWGDLLELMKKNLEESLSRGHPSALPPLPHYEPFHGLFDHQVMTHGCKSPVFAHGFTRGHEHGLGYQGHGHGLCHGGHCPAFVPQGHCPVFGHGAHDQGFGHFHGHGNDFYPGFSKGPYGHSQHYYGHGF